MAVTKGRSGFEGRDFIEFAGPNGINALNFYTFKSNGGLLSGVQAVKREKQGAFDSTSFMMFEDFNRNYLRNKVRVTEKAVATQHAALLAMKDKIIEDAKNYYAAKSANLSSRPGRTVYPSRIDQ